MYNNLFDVHLTNYFAVLYQQCR